MAPFTGFTARRNLFKNREGSGLASQGERNSILHNWQSNREESFRSDKINQMLSQMREEIAASRSQRSQSNLGMFPFRIYNFPSALRRYQNDNDWRRLKVRTGMVIPGGVGAFTVGFDSPGSDAGQGELGETSGGSFGNTYLDEQIPPNSNATVVNPSGFFATWNEYLVAQDDVNYTIWFSFVLPHNAHPGGLQNIPFYGLAACKSSDPTQATLLYTGETFDATNTWPGFGINDPYNFLIGTVFINNTLFPNSPKGLYIDQFQFGNILLPGSPLGTGAEDSPSQSTRITLNSRGPYNASALYYVGDVVSITYADATTVNSNWLYVYDPKSASAYYPTTLLKPMSGISPNGNSPDPWKLLSKSPSDADYHNGAYDASKFYLRTA